MPQRVASSATVKATTAPSARAATYPTDARPPFSSLRLPMFDVGCSMFICLRGENIEPRMSTARRLLKPRPLELLFQVAQGQAKRRRAAVRAVARAVDQLAPRQQRLDLRRRKRVARLHRRLARH